MAAINIGMPRGEHWNVKAECLPEDPELWFPVDGLAGRHRAERAKEICARCPVKDDCLEDNLDVEFGIFGGLDEKQRRKLSAGDRR